MVYVMFQRVLINGLVLDDRGNCVFPEDVQNQTNKDEVYKKYCGDNGKAELTAKGKIKCKCNDGYVGINCQHNKHEVNIADISKQLIDNITSSFADESFSYETIARMND